jgi:hypothetical protein
VPIDDSAKKKSAKLLKNSTLKVMPGAPHGMCTTLAHQMRAGAAGRFAWLRPLGLMLRRSS